MEELYPRHEKQTKNPAETTGYRYKTEILMRRTQKLKGFAAASLILKTLTIPNQRKTLILCNLYYFQVALAGVYGH